MPSTALYPTLLIALSTVLLLFLLPFYLRRVAERLPLVNDVVLCFLVGGALSHTQVWWLPNLDWQAMSGQVAQGGLSASVLLAIPLLLLSSDVRELGKQTGRYLFSFLLCVVAVLVAAFAAAFFFAELPELGTATGGLVGVYIGGTPNLVAVLYALKASDTLFATLNATDAFCSGLYFLALISIARTVYGWVLPQKTPPTPALKEQLEAPATALDDWSAFEHQPPDIEWNRAAFWSIAKALSLTLLCIGLSVVVSVVVFPTAQGNLNELVLMLTLSTASLGLSFLPKLSFGDAVYHFAQYLLLVFAFALGYLVDFSELLATGTTYLLFNIVLLGFLLILHLILARIFKIDVDLFIITATACIMGPPFIGPVCRALRNKSLLAPGMALSLLGLIVGTYLGIAVALFGGS